MAKDSVAQREFGALSSAALIALLLAGCGLRVGGPAPVTSGDESASAPPAQVVVQRGQTLSGIARTYRVPMRVVAEANHLSPPYRILIGQALIIPGGGEPASFGPPVAIAALPAPSPEIAPRATPSEADERGPIPLDRPPAVSAARLPEAAAPPPASAPPGSQIAATPTPPSAAAPRGEPGPSPSAPAAPPAQGPSATPNASAAAAPPPAHGGGTFLWPVRGDILESYGAGPDGTHNDGINIAAPRGAAVQATDAGIVAYVGNELRGYGNLILIKHANGWISAYAHCDLTLVKSGQKVARGQVIARVGSTGNVGEPQLHFELRRGKHAVDPREYLKPLPTAATKEPHAS